jgi:hypothetical protein
MQFPKDVIRPDFLFSFWIFFWFLLYYFFPTLNLPSPVLGLYIALFENLLELFTLIRYNRELSFILQFVAVIVLIKILPLYLLRNVRMVFPQDIYILIGLFSAYLLYLVTQGTNVIEVYRKTDVSLRTGANHTPIHALFHWFIHRQWQ